MKNLFYFISLFIGLMACNNTDNNNNNYNSDSLISEEAEAVELIEEEEILIKINESDSLALLALYNSTNGKNWKKKWDLTKPVNDWSGVTLREFDNKIYVSNLKLANNNLQGKLPDQIFELKHFAFYDSEFMGNKLKFEYSKDKYVKYGDDLNLKVSMDYFELSLNDEDEYTAFVLLKEGVAVYKINPSGKRGAEIGKLAHNEKVTTLRKFEYNPSEKDVLIDNYKGNYISIHYGEDTALVFSAFLSSIPVYIHQNYVQSSYRHSLQTENHDYVEGSGDNTQTQYVKNITDYSTDGYPESSGYITFDKNEFSFQEVYLYANNSFGFIFNEYFGKEFPDNKIDETIEKEGTSIEKKVSFDNQGNISRIYLSLSSGVVEDWEILVTDDKIKVSSGAYD